MSASNYTFFNKYTVVNDVITEGYSCQTFGISGFEPVCLKRSTDGSTYGDDTTGNKGMLKTLSTNGTFTGADGFCAFISYYSNCYVGTLDLYAHSNGNVHASDRDVNAGCSVYNDGYASCGE